MCGCVGGVGWEWRGQSVCPPPQHCFPPPQHCTPPPPHPAACAPPPHLPAPPLTGQHHLELSRQRSKARNEGVALHWPLWCECGVGGSGWGGRGGSECVCVCVCVMRGVPSTGGRRGCLCVRGGGRGARRADAEPLPPLCTPPSLTLRVSSAPAFAPDKSMGPRKAPADQVCGGGAWWPVGGRRHEPQARGPSARPPHRAPTQPPPHTPTTLTHLQQDDVSSGGGGGAHQPLCLGLRERGVVLKEGVERGGYRSPAPARPAQTLQLPPSARCRPRRHPPRARTAPPGSLRGMGGGSARVGDLGDRPPRPPAPPNYPPIPTPAHQVVLNVPGAAELQRRKGDLARHGAPRLCCWAAPRAGMWVGVGE